MLSSPNPKDETRKESTSISFCKPPEVPKRIRLRVFFFLFMVRVLKSIFTKASSSLTTISILSGPIPVAITLILFPFKIPVWVTNSLFCILCSILSNLSEITLTLSGSPTSIMSLAISSLDKLRW